MADIPNLDAQQIESQIDAVSDVQFVGRGGQKIVFSGIVKEQRFALKFSKAPGEDDIGSDETEFEYDPDVLVRAKREVETMRRCDSPYMVKLGPIGLERVEIRGIGEGAKHVSVATVFTLPTTINRAY